MESDQHVAVKSERNDTSFECRCDEGSTVEKTNMICGIGHSEEPIMLHVIHVFHLIIAEFMMIKMV